MKHDLFIRKALPEDAASMTILLNDIIEDGGWTAMNNRIFPEDQRRFIANFPGNGIFNVALFRSGQLVGLQDVIPGDLPGTGNISTFVDLRYLRQGIGRVLWESTLNELRSTSMRSIRAVVRGDNQAGRKFYNSLGFQKAGLVSSDGMNTVSRVIYELQVLPHPDM